MFKEFYIKNTLNVLSAQVFRIIVFLPVIIFSTTSCSKKDNGRRSTYKSSSRSIMSVDIEETCQYPPLHHFSGDRSIQMTTLHYSYFVATSRIRTIVPKVRVPKVSGLNTVLAYISSLRILSYRQETA
jgi:hypothetical protein